jgi:hypothetical protein
MSPEQIRSDCCDHCCKADGMDGKMCQRSIKRCDSYASCAECEACKDFLKLSMDFVRADKILGTKTRYAKG